MPFLSPTHALVRDERALVIVLAVSALAAYSIGGVPLPWVSVLLGVIVSLRYGMKCRRVLWPAGATALSILICFSFAVGISQWQVHPMPAGATLPYSYFIIARYIELAAFLLFFVFSYNVACRSDPTRIIRMVVLMAGIVAAYSLYAYISQLYGLWEIPRSRMGTGGQDFLREEVRFTYAFHRALGTFREPVHFVQWLAGPFILSFSLSGTKVRAAQAVMLIALLLSGSLLGVIALLVGLGVYLVSRKGVERVYRIAGLGAVTILLGVVLAYLNVPLFSVIGDRLGVLINQGVGATNRGYIFDYVIKTVPPVFGYGLGNSNLILSSYNGSSLIQSHLNLFVNAWMSLGLVGLGLLVSVMLRHLAAGLKAIHQGSGHCAVSVGAYCAWMVIFLGDAETLSLMFAFIGGLMLAMVRMQVKVRR